MNHLFYFKKGDKVPQWLYSVSVGGNFVDSDFKFCTAGKVLCDDVSGHCYIWPSKNRFRYIAKIKNISDAIISGAGECKSGSCETHMFFATGRKSFGKVLSGTVRVKLNVSPLTVARLLGYDIRTSTKYDRIPDAFQRVTHTSPIYIK